MLDLTTCREVVRREIAADLARLGRAAEEDWDRPTRLRAWSVRDLARHIAYGQQLEAEAMRRAREGIPEAADAATPGPDPGSILAAIRRNREQLLAEMDRHTPESLGSAICPMYYGPVPGPFAVNVWAFEAGVHANDLAAALGEDLPLAPDVVQATATVLGASLPLLAMAATERPVSPVAFLLAGDTVRLGLRYDGASWQPSPGPAEETVRISGDDTTVLLFALGRIVLDHPSLAVSGSQGEARRFKGLCPRALAPRVGSLQDHRKPVRAPVLRWPVEQPRAAGTAAPAASVLGQVPGAEPIPIPPDQQLATGMAPGTAALDVVDIAGVGVADAVPGGDLAAPG